MKRTTISLGELDDRMIEMHFENTKFGNRDHRKLLEQGVLKRLAGYRSGHTLTEIMKGLGLLTNSGNVSKHGRMFLFRSFQDSGCSG